MIAILIAAALTVHAQELVLEPSEKRKIRETLVKMMDCRNLSSCFSNVEQRIKELSPAEATCAPGGEEHGPSQGDTAYIRGCAFVDNSLKPYTAYPKENRGKRCGSVWSPAIHTMTCSSLKNLEARIDIDDVRCYPDDPKQCGIIVEIPSPAGQGKVRGKFKHL